MASTAEGSVDPRTGKASGKRNRMPIFGIFRYADRLDVFLMVVGTLGSAATGAALPFFSVLLSRVTNAFLGTTSTLEATVNQTSLYFLILGIGIMVVSFFGIFCWTLTGCRQTTRIKNLFLSSALEQNLSYFDEVGGPGFILNYLTEEAGSVMDATGNKVSRFIQNVSTAVTGFIIAFVRGWQMTLVMLSMTPLFIVISAIAARATHKLKLQDNEAYARANIISLEALSNVRTVNASNGQEPVLDAYSAALSGPMSVGVKIGLVKGIIIGLYLLITYGAYALALWFGSVEIGNQAYDGGTVVNVLFAAILGAFSLAAALPLLQVFSKGRESAAGLFKVIDRTSDLPFEGGNESMAVQGHIEFRNIAFAYPSQPEVYVFQDLNLTIKAGTSMALVGESGSGKSTIVGLLERFYDPNRGAVLLDGTDLRALNLPWFRSQVGLVQQEPVLFAGTIAENIRVGSTDASQDRIEEVAKAANVHDFICSLPEKYDTLVGEKGTQLSGGQKQRLAIARALLRDPRILLLDEATSALDTESERIVQKALDSIMQNRTSVIIAHRLSTVVNADAIAVLQRGVIVEQGNHKDLIAKGGIYSNLAQAQNLGVESGVAIESGVDRLSPLKSSTPDRDLTIGVFMGEMSKGSMRTLSGFVSGAISFAIDRKASPKTAFPSPPKKEKRGGGIFKPCFDPSIPESEDVKSDKEQSSDQAQKEKGSNFQRIAALNATEWPMALVGIAGAAGMGAVQPAYAYLLSKSVNTLYNPDIAAMKSQVSVYSGIFVGIGCAALLCSVAMFAGFGLMGQKLAVRVRMLVFRSMLRQEIAWFDSEENNTGVLVSRLTADARAVKGQFGDSMGFLVQNATMIVVALCLAFATNWHLAIVVVAASPTVVITALASMEFVSRASSAQTNLGSMADGTASEALYNIRTVAALGMEREVTRRYQQKLERALWAGARLGSVEGAGYGIGQFFVYCMYSLSFWYGGKLIVSGIASPNEILSVFLPIFMAAFGAGQAQMYFPDVARGRAAATRVFSIVDRVPIIDNLSDDGLAPLECKGHLEFERVRFAYPARPNLFIFQSFSLDVPEGTSMALVGESGSGKSTVVGLIQRFYAPLSGAVLLDGHDISTLNLKWLRSQVGLVGQEPVLFSMSIRDNITYAAGSTDMEEVKAGAKAAYADDFIDALPQGYDTLIGSGGMALSGGQKQRLAIARALLKKPKILLLDEATSALDVESEKLVTAALDTVMQSPPERTSIIVAHKLNTIKNANCISVLKQGKIVEHGTHTELVRLNGIYSKLLKIQEGSTAH